MAMRSDFFFYYLVTLSFCSLCIAGCKEGIFLDEETKNAHVIPIQKRTLEIYNYRIAEIAALKNVEIRNHTSGYLASVNADEGEKVRSGQLLFTFNAEEVTTRLSKEIANLKSTEAEEKVARLELERLSGLVAKDIISPLQLEIAKAKLNALEAKVASIQQMVALAELNVSYMDIKAPFDGVINRIPYKSGSFLNEGTLLTHLSDISKVYAYFYVSETEYLKMFKRNLTKKAPTFDTSTKIGLILSDGTKYNQQGIIQTIGGEFESNTGTIIVRALFPNPGGILKHRASAKVVIPIYLENALLVPQKSVLDIQTKKYVYILQPDRSVKIEPISYTYRYKDYFIVTAGVKEGDTIIYDGLQHIKEKTRVMPQIINADSLWQHRPEADE